MVATEENEVTLSIRFPEKLDSLLTALAAKEHRSKNGQIVFMLETMTSKAKK
jgi:hypothetical protein